MYRGQSFRWILFAIFSTQRRGNDQEHVGEHHSSSIRAVASVHRYKLGSSLSMKTVGIQYYRRARMAVEVVVVVVLEISSETRASLRAVVHREMSGTT